MFLKFKTHFYFIPFAASTTLLIAGCGKDLLQTLQPDPCKVSALAPGCTPSAPEPTPVATPSLNGWQEFRHAGNIHHAQISPNHQFLSVEGPQAITLWNVKTQKMLHQINGQFIPGKNDILFHPNGENFLTVNGNEIVVYRLSDSEVTEIARQPLEDIDHIDQIAIHPQGDLFYLRSTVRKIYAVYTWKNLQKIETIPNLPHDDLYGRALELIWHPKESTLLELHRGEVNQILARSFAHRPSTTHLIAQEKKINSMALERDGSGLFVEFSPIHYAYFEWTRFAFDKEIHLIPNNSENLRRWFVLDTCLSEQRQAQILLERDKSGADLFAFQFPEKDQIQTQIIGGPYGKCLAIPEHRVTAFCELGHTEYVPGQKKETTPGSIALHRFDLKKQTSIPLPDQDTHCEGILADPEQKMLYIFSIGPSRFYSISIEEPLKKIL